MKSLAGLKLFFEKLLVHPFKYGRGGDYDAKRYWDDRFRKHDLNIKSVGIEGLSEEENLALRREGEKLFKDVCRDRLGSLKGKSVLDVGCGAGLYTAIMRQESVGAYTGVDITDAYFQELQTRFPGYAFIRKDVTADALEGAYDVILFMDVIEHIVNDEKCNFAFENFKRCLKKGGTLIMVPVTDHKKKHMFHVRFWSCPEIEARLGPGYGIEKIRARQDEYLLVITKNV